MRAPDVRTVIRADIPSFAADPAKACTKVNPEVFFPAVSGKLAAPAIKIAKDISRLCPRREECAEWAITTMQGYGVFGATTPAERAAIRAIRRRAAA